MLHNTLYECVQNLISSNKFFSGRDEVYQTANFQPEKIKLNTLSKAHS